jgi:hypothetical protein
MITEGDLIFKKQAHWGFTKKGITLYHDARYNVNCQFTVVWNNKMTKYKTTEEVYWIGDEKQNFTSVKKLLVELNMRQPTNNEQRSTNNEISCKNQI